jgi:hypothetical protein
VNIASPMIALKGKTRIGDDHVSTGTNDTQPTVERCFAFSPSQCIAFTGIITSIRFELAEGENSSCSVKVITFTFDSRNNKIKIKTITRINDVNLRCVTTLNVNIHVDFGDFISVATNYIETAPIFVVDEESEDEDIRYVDLKNGAIHYEDLAVNSYLDTSSGTVVSYIEYKLEYPYFDDTKLTVNGDVTIEGKTMTIKGQDWDELMGRITALEELAGIHHSTESL